MPFSNDYLDASVPRKETPADPVLPDQGGRMMESDPGHTVRTAEEEQRRRAYAIYEARGREDGKALDHWLAAESQNYL